MSKAPDLLDRFDIRSVPIVERSMAENLALLDPEERAAILDALTEAQAEAIAYDWDFWGRPDQQEPPRFASGEATVLFIKAGRGFGKTRTGAETTRRRVKMGKARRSIVAGPTAGDTRDILIEGESGVMAVCPPDERPDYQPSKRRLVWPNGSVTAVLSADEPDRFRGQNTDWVWGDEPASWRYGEETWDNIELGLRHGAHPQALLTGTPRPVKWLKNLLADPSTEVVAGSSFRNLGNLAPTFISRILAKYEGTRLGLQELYAMVLEDVEGALWRRSVIDEHRYRWRADESGKLLVPELDFVVVGVDPSVTTTGDEAGIVVAGRQGVRDTGHAYVLEDYSLQGHPTEWAAEVVRAYTVHEADIIVAESNNGGELVETVIHAVAPNLPVRLVNASRGKTTRAAPYATMYDHGRVHHVGVFPELETEMTEWVPPAPSPNRMDALVWSLEGLFGDLRPKKKRKRKVKVLS